MIKLIKLSLRKLTIPSILRTNKNRLNSIKSNTRRSLTNRHHINSLTRNRLSNLTIHLLTLFSHIKKLFTLNSNLDIKDLSLKTRIKTILFGLLLSRNNLSLTQSLCKTKETIFITLTNSIGTSLFSLSGIKIGLRIGNFRLILHTLNIAESHNRSILSRTINTRAGRIR